MENALYHLKNTRPQWYKDYHEWEHHAVLHWVTFAVSCVIILIGFINVIAQPEQKIEVKQAGAATATTVVSQQVTNGSLTINNTGNQTMGSIGVDIISHNTTGSLGDITVTDSRGSGVGWTAAATSTNFYKYNDPVTTGGTNGTVTIGSSSIPYATSSAGTYLIAITNIDGGSGAGQAEYSVSGLESTQVNATTGTNVPVGSLGLRVTFASASYTLSDRWTVRVDTIPVTGFMVDPQTVSTISGDSSNVLPGSIDTFTATNDAITLMNAEAGYGMGQYKVTPDLTLTVPANTYANTYTATVTETAT